jgi:hypothetical protein
MLVRRLPDVVAGLITAADEHRSMPGARLAVNEHKRPVRIVQIAASILPTGTCIEGDGDSTSVFIQVSPDVIRIIGSEPEDCRMPFDQYL